MSRPDLPIEALLPHRHPFLFVHGVIAVEGDHGTQGFFRVPDDHPFLNAIGGQAVFPDFLLVEALGQLAAVCLRSQSPSAAVGSRPRGYLVRVDHCRFDGEVCAGDCLTLSARLLASFGTLYKFETRGEVAGNPVVQAHITLYLDA
jgi:3-hydroxymyristoyl/3-hydroxydecanoyl-(acyl carrier protein) dehydratase